MEAAVVVLAGGQREGDPAGHLVAGDDGRQHVGTGGAYHLAGCQRGGDHRRAGMQRAGGVGVVEVQRMRQRAVQERGAGGRVARGVAEHAGIAGGHAHGADRGEERRRALRVMPRADDVADQVQHQEARALHHVRRQAVEADVGGELREFCGDAHGDVPPAVRPLWRRPRASEQDLPNHRRDRTGGCRRRMSGTSQKVPNRALITLCVMMGNLMQSLDASIANVSLPYMQGTLSTSADEITWVLTSYVIAAAIMTAPVGWMAVRFGRKNLHVACMSGFVVASMLCGMADTLQQMVAFRFLQGMCGAALVPLSPGDDAGHLSVRAARPGDGDLRHGRDGGADHRADARWLPDRDVQLALRVLREPAVRRPGDHRPADLPAEGGAARRNCGSTGPGSPCWRWAWARCS